MAAQHAAYGAVTLGLWGAGTTMIGIAMPLRLLALLAVLCLALAGCTGSGEGEGDDTSRDPDADAEEAAGDDPPDDAAAAEDATEEADGAAGAAEPDGAPGEAGSWTFLVYIVGDTDLEPFALQDLTEMAEVGSQAGVEIVAMVDRSPDYSADPVVDLENWESTKLLRVLPGSLEELEDLGEVNMGVPESLAGFLEYGVTTYPADRTALVLWDHGGGWTGIGPDETDGHDVLELGEVTAGIEQGLAATGLEQLDLLGFDACLMATYEVASEVAPYATHMLASEETEPGHGWDYRSLQALVDDPALDGAGLGSALLEGYVAHAAENQRGEDITLSLLDLGQVPVLDEAMSAFAATLQEQVDALGPIVGQERAEGLDFGRNPDPAQAKQLTDLGVLVSEIGVESLQVSDAADDVLRAIDDVVLETVNGPARAGATGLSIYFPSQAELTDPAYADIPSAAPWLGFLEAYQGAGAAVAEELQPAVADPEGGAVLTPVEGGLEVAALFDPATLENAVSATAYFGYADPESGALVLLEDREAEIAEDGTVSGFTDLTFFTITDGEDTIRTYFSLEVDDEAGTGTATIPLQYLAPEADEPERIDLSIVVDPETGDVLQETFFVVDEEAGTYGELTADPGGLLAPVVLVYPPDGGEPAWSTFGETAVFADLPILQYGTEAFEAGTAVYADITVTDFGGNEAVASGTITLE